MCFRRDYGRECYEPSVGLFHAKTSVEPNLFKDSRIPKRFYMSMDHQSTTIMRRATYLLYGILAMATTLLFAGCSGPNLIDRLNYGWGFGLCGTIIVILDIIAILEIVGSNRSFGSKALWSLIIVFFPLGGLIFYWIFGK